MDPPHQGVCYYILVLWRETMKVVKITESIKYFALSDEEGEFGLLFDEDKQVFAEIYTPEDFVSVYNQFTQLN